MVNIQKIIEIAKKNIEKQKLDGQSSLSNIITSNDFIDLINSEGKIIYLNKNMHSGNSLRYRHEAEYLEFIFKTFTKKKIYDL